jgi:hypothetical protein
MGKLDEGSGELVKLDPKTLQVVHTITKEELVPKYIDFETTNGYAEAFFQDYGIYLWSQTMGDLIEGIETMPQNENAALDFDWVNRFAGLLNPHRHGKTLAERRAVLQAIINDPDSPVDLIEDMERWERLVEHGVQQFVNPTCTVCGSHVGETPFRVDPLSFLPGRQEDN